MDTIIAECEATKKIKFTITIEDNGSTLLTTLRKDGDFVCAHSSTDLQEAIENLFERAVIIGKEMA